jgi:hypothetical protein
MKKFLVFGIEILTIGIAVSASTLTVKQGDFSVTNPTDLRSPMVIETVFAPAVDTSLWTKKDGKKPSAWEKGAWFTVSEYHDLGKFTCDGLLLQRDYSRRRNAWDSALEMRVLEHGNQTEVDLHVTVRSPNYIHDKLVTLNFEVLSGNVQWTTSVTVKVKEGSENDDSAKMVLSSAALKTNPAPTLRITMTTMDY